MSDSMSISVQVQVLAFGELRSNHILVLGPTDANQADPDPIWLPTTTSAAQVVAQRPVEVLKRYTPDAVMSFQ
jgi:hypothetical protein